MAETTEEVTYDVLDRLVDIDTPRLRDVAWAEIVKLRNALTLCSQDQHDKLHDGSWDKCERVGCVTDKAALGWPGSVATNEGETDG